MTRLRFVDVDVTEAQFAGSDEPETQLAPEVELAPGESIVSITARYRKSGTMGSDLTVVARVWIAS